MKSTPALSHLTPALQPYGSHPHTFTGVQALRAFAAFMVVAVHASRLWSLNVSGSKETLMWHAGNAGVDIFFVISGFVMTLTTTKERQDSHPGFRFLLRRAARIYPVYWLSTLPGLLHIASAFRSHIWTVSYVVTSLALVPGNGPYGPIGPINGVGWTLIYEMFFYMLMAGALTLRVRPLLVLCPLLLLIAVTGPFLQHSHLPVVQLASPLLLEFLAGMFVATVSVRLLHLPRIPLLLAAGVSCAILIWEPLPLSPWSRFLMSGIPAAFLVGSVVGLERSFGTRIPRFALLLGDASYVLYLTHLFTLDAVNRLPLGLSRSGDFRRSHQLAYILITLVLASVLAIIAHKLVEVPLQKWTKAGIRRFEAAVFGIRSTPLDGPQPDAPATQAEYTPAPLTNSG